MTNFDKEYLELIKKILKEGEEVPNRTGINTIKIPKYNFEFDLSKEFPILETKQTAWKNAIIEMLWIWQMASNDVRDLHDRNVHIWDEWMVDEDGIYRIYEPEGTCDYDPNKEVVVLDPLSVDVDDPFGEFKPLEPKYDENGKVMTAKSIKEGRTIKMAKYYGKEYAYTIGTAYGYIVNRYKHALRVINTIKNNPNCRRMVKSLWQDEFLRTAVLPSCVWSTEWNVTKDKVNLQVHQRSCDVPLGLPFNVTQYATLLKMIAQVTDKEPGIISYSIQDAHIYTNQLEGINELLRRERRYYELTTFSETDLYSYKYFVEKKKTLLDEKSAEYKKLDTEERMVDLILNPNSPTLELDQNIDDFFKFDNSKELKHIKVKNYKHMGNIKFPLAQ